MGDITGYFTVDLRNIEGVPCNIISVMMPELTHKNIRVVELGIEKFFGPDLKYMTGQMNAVNISTTYKIDNRGLKTLEKFAKMNKEHNFPTPYLQGCSDHVRNMLEITRLDQLYRFI